MADGRVVQGDLRSNESAGSGDPRTALQNCDSTCSSPAEVAIAPHTPYGLAIGPSHSIFLSVARMDCRRRYSIGWKWDGMGSHVAAGRGRRRSPSWCESVGNPLPYMCFPGRIPRFDAIRDRMIDQNREAAASPPIVPSHLVPLRGVRVSSALRSQPRAPGAPSCRAPR